jgi:homoserine dehydrogenase
VGAGAGTLRVGIAGLGTVGGGVLDLLRANADLLEARAGRRLAATAVSARDPRKQRRGVDLAGLRWHDDPRALAEDPEVDLVCELIGGSDGVALELTRSALRRGRPVVTANKAMLALHGGELAALAEASGAALAFEAAVAGGVPIVKALREGLAANRIARVHGILNGTCNYILTQMRETGRDFADVLAEAQALGYAEADPAFDVDGIDAAHKLAILAALAFGGRPRFDAIHVEGIRHVSAVDIAFARELGYRIKLLGVARMTPQGLEQRLHPCMVPEDAPIAQVEGVFNGVVVEGDRVGTVLFEGRGAGAGPTASAVVADIVDVARGLRLPAFGVPSPRLAEHPAAPMTAHEGRYYIRLVVLDRPGVLAEVAAALRDHEVSIESLIQRGRNPGQAVPIVLTSHDTTEAAMRGALDHIGSLGSVLEPPRMIRIERP